MRKKKYSAIIIGAGSIGALKPDEYDYPRKTKPLTHAHAFYNNPRIDLIGIYDKNISKARHAAEKWNTKTIGSLDDFTADIISVCSPTETHYEMLYKAISMKPQLVIAEKPFCNSLEEAKEVQKFAEKNNVSVLVNYTRRFEISTHLIKNSLDVLNFNKVHACILLYGRGLKREASHAIDLFNYWFGDFLSGSMDPNGLCFSDYRLEDLTYTVNLHYENCKNVVLLPVDSKDYGIFEIQLITDEGIISFENNGIFMQVRKVEEEDIYGNYKVISSKRTRFKTNLTDCLKNMSVHAVNFLDGLEDLKCTIDDAIMVHDVYNKLGV